MYTDEIRQSSSRDHIESKGLSSGPVHKKDKSHRHQPYRGNSEQSHTSGRNSTQYCAIPKPRMGMVCFRCGDPHRRRDCTWSGDCSLCGQNHKDVVCRKNPNGKVCWEEISSSASSGTVQMLATPPSTYWSMPPTQQCLMAPPVTCPIVPTPQSGGYWLPHAPTPSAPMVPFHYPPNGVTTRTTSSSGISGAHATPPSDGRNHGNVITGNILVIPSLLE